MGYNKRDSKDPMPTADNSRRQNEAGNIPVTGEKHDQKKGSKISSSQNRTTGPTAMAVTQPTRNVGGADDSHGIGCSGGNVPVNQAPESHDQKKSQHITESQRW